MEKSKNPFRDYIETLIQLDSFPEQQPQIPQKQEDTTRNFVNQLAKQYGIPFSEQDIEVLIGLVNTAREIAPDIAQILHDSGYNILLINEIDLYEKALKTLPEIIFQVFLLGIAFGEIHDGQY